MGIIKGIGFAIAGFIVLIIVMALLFEYVDQYSYRTKQERLRREDEEHRAKEQQKEQLQTKNLHQESVRYQAQWQNHHLCQALSAACYEEISSAINFAKGSFPAAYSPTRISISCSSTRLMMHGFSSLFYLDYSNFGVAELSSLEMCCGLQLAIADALRTRFSGDPSVAFEITFSPVGVRVVCDISKAYRPLETITF